jgi:hypothetical protein
MNSPAKDMADLICLSSSPISVIGFGVDVFVGMLPQTPIECVTFYNTNGWSSAANYTYERPTIQALVRTSSYEAGYALAHAIKTHLHGQNGVTINNARYIQILAEGDVVDLPPEETKQHRLFSINFAAHRTIAT